MPLKALEVGELNLFMRLRVLQSMKMLQCTETGAEYVGYVSMVTLNHPPPPQKCPTTQEVSDSMAHLCSFLLDCIETNNKNGVWET